MWLELVHKFDFRLVIKKLRNTVAKTHACDRTYTYMYSPSVVASVKDSTHAVQVNCVLLRKDLNVPEDQAKVGIEYTHDRLYNICT